MLDCFLLFKLLCFAFFIYFGFSFLKLVIRNTILILLFSKRHKLRKYGNWAVVTGSTDGIGKALALLLAKDGWNLVLISRSKNKLDNVKAMIKVQYNVEVRVIESDFTKVDIYNNIESQIKDLEISLLINNVGMLIGGNLESYHLKSDDFINIIHCNCLSMIMMTRIMLRSTNMVNKGGIIVNLSSAAGTVKVPFMSVYSGTKGFVDVFSAAMNTELSKSSKVFVQNIAPYLVSTNMSKAAQSLTTLSTEDYAETVLNRLGVSKYSNGCFTHEIQHWLIGYIPVCIRNNFVYKHMKKYADFVSIKKEKDK